MNLSIDRDIMVLANPEIARLPAWIVALVAAGGLAAALSTAAGLLLVISTSIAHDLLKKGFKPEISEKHELRYARIAAGTAVVIAGFFGINPPDYVAAVVAFAFGLAASSFFPAIIMGIFSKRVTREGAHHRYDLRLAVHRHLHRLFQIHRTGQQHRRTLVVRYLARGYRHPGHVAQFRRSPGDHTIHATATRRNSEHGGRNPSSWTQSQLICRPALQDLMVTSSIMKAPSSSVRTERMRPRKPIRPPFSPQ